MKAAEYRRNASDCLRIAQELTEPKTKTVLVNMASAWMRLVDQAEKNSKTDLVYETPPSRADSVGVG